jgi:hypothetical protein
MVAENPEGQVVNPSRNATPFNDNDNISARLDELDGDVKDVLAAVQGGRGGDGATDFTPVLTPLGNMNTVVTGIQTQVAGLTASVQALAAGLGINIAPAPAPISVTAPTINEVPPVNEESTVQPNPDL